ncbi:ABC transporter permease [Leifsonia sp. SIMBA_070]|uniref:ABC transporter permease n=1 Tax=Leifsonia sp. SIMBA_070 TaxID=3085810 RepID=UPI00397E8B28
MTAPGWVAAVSVETQKMRAARVPLVTLVLLAIGVAAICLSTTIAATTGSPGVVAKLGPLVAAGGWPGYLNAALQVTAAAAAGGCGILLSWTFGREFSEGTVSGLFALPISRVVIASAKILTYLVWSVLAAVAIAGVLLLGGFAAGLGAMSGADLGVVLRIPVLVLTTACMALPAAWAATLSRRLLGGIAVTIGLVASAQVLVFAGAGAWYPPAAPALWALRPDQVNGDALMVGMLAPVAFIVLIVLAWRRLQLDR